MKYFIFFSWQSDTESKYNRSYIKGLPNDIFKEDIPDGNDSYWDRIEKNQEEIRNLVDNVRKSHQLFRDSVKKYLLI